VIFRKLRVSMFVKAACFFVSVAASSAEPSPTSDDVPARLAEGVQDNSFLVEEAYNQDPGVVQHALTVFRSVDRHAGVHSDGWEFGFTQEWPAFSQKHQLSYSVPYSFLEDDGHSSRGFEDVVLTYRYQALTESARRPAFAPGVSLILPTGDANNGFGNDTVGYHIGLPLSKVVSNRWTVHGNAGATLLPHVDGHDLLSYNLGASAIYAVTARFNLMLEFVTNWDEEVADRGGTSRDAAVVISPGFRYAFNHRGGAQTVVGLAAPIGLTSAASDYGIFIYLSFEHAFLRSNKTGTAK
jgi:outer membrane putative beta-barrel porin/alpha-amylase